jgi:hypothetical protein
MARPQLDVAGQRLLNGRAIGRFATILLGLFSLVTLTAHSVRGRLRSARITQ